MAGVSGTSACIGSSSRAMVGKPFVGFMVALRGQPWCPRTVCERRSDHPGRDAATGRRRFFDLPKWPSLRVGIADKIVPMGALRVVMLLAQAALVAGLGVALADRNL